MPAHRLTMHAAAGVKPPPFFVRISEYPSVDQVWCADASQNYHADLYSYLYNYPCTTRRDLGAPRPDNAVDSTNWRTLGHLFANATSASHGTHQWPLQLPQLKHTEVQHRSAAETRASRIAEIQASLGISIQAMAEVLQISRVQLYKWMDPEVEIRLQSDSLARLDSVWSIAQLWRSKTEAPLSPWINERIDGSSLQELLSARTLDEGRINRAFDALIAWLKDAPKSRAQKFREAGFKPRASAYSLPSDE